MAQIEAGSSATEFENTPPRLRSADQVPVSEIMTRNVICVRPALSAETLERLFIEKNISGAPVVDAEGRVVGMVSKTDLLHSRAAGAAFASATASSVMTPTTYFLGENESVAKAAGMMAFESVHRVPVISPNGGVVGIVSPLDVMRWLARDCGYPIANHA
jgi:predicted transcriptional regulator